MDIQVKVVELVIALAMITLYTWSRYQTPATIRSETTWSKFLLGRVAYLAIILTLFFLLIRIPTLLSALLELASVGHRAVGIENLQKQSSMPLIAALILTVFLSEIPILAKIDRGLRKFFHRLAAIPRERRHWIGLLKRAVLLPGDAQIHARLVEKFALQQLDAGDIVMEGDRSPQLLWTRASVLIDRLVELEDHRKYSDCLLKCTEYKALKVQYERLTPKATHCIKLASSDSDSQAVQLLKAEFVEQTETLLMVLYKVTSGLILKCGRTQGQRYECFEHLGLTPPEDPPRGFTVHEATWILLLVILFFGLTARQLAFPIIFLIALNYLGAALVALAVTSLRTHWFPKEVTGHRVAPIGHYLLAGLGGTALASILTIWHLTLRASGTGAEFFEHLLYGQSQVISDFLRGYWPWTLLSGCLALVIAALTDGWIDARFGTLRQRFDIKGWVNPLEGVILAIAMSATAMLVVHPLLSGLENAAMSLPASEILGLRAGGAGLIIGSLIPLWYRRRNRTQETNGEGESQTRALILQMEG